MATPKNLTLRMEQPRVALPFPPTVTLKLMATKISREIVLSLRRLIL